MEITLLSFIKLMVSLGLSFTVQAETTWYNPELGGINCDSNCFTISSNTPLTENMFGNIVACPIELPIGTIITIKNSKYGLADGIWQCGDSGGNVVVYDNYISLDLLIRYPVWREIIIVTVYPPPVKIIPKKTISEIAKRVLER